MWQFFALHFWTLFAGFGAVGFVAIAVLFVTLGWSFAAMVKAALDLAREAIKFFETPLGEIVGFLILIVLAWFAADLRRTRIDAGLCEKRIEQALANAAAQAENARAHRDRAIQSAMKAAANREIEGIEAEKNQLEQKAKDHERDLAKRPACLVTPDDLADGVRGHT